MNDPIRHPEWEALLADIALLQDELSHALGELDHLQTHTRPYLLALYQRKIGHDELACLRAKCKAEWLRRFVERAQAARNRGAPAVPEHIEAELHIEMRDFWDGLRSAADQIEAAQRFMGALMKPEQSAEFRRLYRQLVKRLHPDINPTLGDREKLLWRRAQQAHESGDIEELRLLWQSVETLTETATGPRIEEVRGRRESLLGQIRRVRERLEALEKQPPFNLRDKLDDETWVRDTLAGIATASQAHDERAEYFRGQLRVLFGEAAYDIERQFDEN